ncbi:MAG: hydrogenase formation protein HypD [Deltaproteobacteria bacterium]|nr:hydrogenase formation protein HypD [Deltaproteobacteria bacterium]
MTIDPHAAAETAYARIASMVNGPLAFMEVCGTHTMAIGRAGLRTRLPDDLRLVSGPGCPVCVTPAVDIERAAALAVEPGVTVATFGDLLRVPGANGTLQEARARGGQVKVVYAATEALDLAEIERTRTVVFVGIGFETTTPTVAATVLRAQSRGVHNFCVLPAFKLVPPAMHALASDPEIRIDGFLCPGHVSSILGTMPYEPVAREHRIPCVVAGFEPLEILSAIEALLLQLEEGRCEVENRYARAVPTQGNPAARAIMDRVFVPCDASWRGIGMLPASGLAFRPEYAEFDALERVPVNVPEVEDLPAGCGCGDVMKGRIQPPECRLFGHRCTPARPVGPCMVSSEGACAAWYKYGGGS